MTHSQRNLVCGVALLSTALATPISAQQSRAGERFTFVAADASAAGPTGTGRLDLVISRWSGDDERDRVRTVLKESGPSNLLSGLRDAYAAGWISWPGNLQYTLRYARRTPRADGGEDVTIVADSRLWMWWEGARTVDAGTEPYTVIRLRLTKDGTGTGTVSFGAKVQPDEAAGIALADDASGLLTDLRRERSRT